MIRLIGFPLPFEPEHRRPRQQLSRGGRALRRYPTRNEMPPQSAIAAGPVTGPTSDAEIGGGTSEATE
jgi:hypothetical protein